MGGGGHKHAFPAQSKQKKGGGGGGHMPALPTPVYVYIYIYIYICGVGWVRQVSLRSNTYCRHGGSKWTYRPIYIESALSLSYALFPFAERRSFSSTPEYTFFSSV